MPTIKQLANELGMTKQGIRKYMNQLPAEHMQKNDKGIIQIMPDAAQKIRKLVQQKQKPVTGNDLVTKPVTGQSVPSEITTLISMLQKELDSKNATIESQNRQLEQAHQSIQDLTATLASAQLSAQQAQALHAGTIHKQLQEGEPQPVIVTDPAKPGPSSTPNPEEPPLAQPEKRPGIFARLFGAK